MMVMVVGEDDEDDGEEGSRRFSGEEHKRMGYGPDVGRRGFADVNRCGMHAEPDAEAVNTLADVQ